MQPIHVRATPGHYQCQNGVLDELPDRLKEGGFRNIFIIHGEKSWEAARHYIPELSQFHAAFSKYRGECSYTEIERQAELGRLHDADLVIGVGGGKVLDVAKAVANELTIETALIPTLASTCAACTPLSVIYTDRGEFVRHIVYPRSTHLVLVEPEILLHSPSSFLRAGIGDTLAKWYEARSIIETLPSLSVPIQFAYFAAKSCRDTLLEHGEQALKDQKDGNLSESFIKVIETNLLTGAMVGGFGDQYGRVAGAHAVHNALTHQPETHSFLHGEKVAYGILAQLALEEKWEEIKDLLPFYELVELPTSLGALGIHEEESFKKAESISQYATKKEESIHITKHVRKDELLEAITKLEAKAKISSK
ncbi:iron-containing alcohol dehydrogenase family protein [Guptibacillus algicola]|uniref:iron-containing alcohol dehydrogenase family protein n=1 Tax=Guptibacillus algicola TaxID=225844 RepID=UPI001CD2A4EF|nr:iron-containing alcohol dehydrogenase family protein [Alkalihalobacillus algicola]MCA0986907.1 iron-containing alcohol dehydrogenase family protein [Alkalihalobacillus algicola]